jgi:hypothetical protein
MRLHLALLALVVSVSSAVAADTSFLLQNRSEDIIIEAFVMPVQGGGRVDVLGTNVLGPGKQKRVTGPSNRGCVFNMIFTFADGHEVGRSNVNLCEISRISTTGAGIGINWQ